MFAGTSFLGLLNFVLAGSLRVRGGLFLSENLQSSLCKHVHLRRAFVSWFRTCDLLRYCSDNVQPLNSLTVEKAVRSDFPSHGA